MPLVLVWPLHILMKEYAAICYRGFSGVETVGAVNDFVHESIKQYYSNIYMSDVRVILVSATDKILEQIDEGLGKFALEKQKENGLEFIMNTYLVVYSKW